MDWLSRTELLLGEERLGLLKNAHVLVAGLGGVGAYAAEQLCRAGIGEMTIIDGDCVDVTNKNREMNLGDTEELRLDKSGISILYDRMCYYSDIGVAAVNAKGTGDSASVIAVGPGKATITCEYS